MTIESIPFVGLTAPVLVGIAVLMLLNGRIVPRATYRDKAEEAEKWRVAYETEREARTLSNRQTIELLEVTKLTNSIVVAAFGQQGVVWRQGQDDENPTKT